MPTILIVDDEERITDITEKFLKLNGFAVIKAAGGVEAVKILNSDARFDLMLLDMKMPQVNGLGVMQKKKELGRDFPVLLLTGSIDAEKYLDVLRGVGLAPEDILYKPIDLRVLLGEIKKKLRMA